MSRKHQLEVSEFQFFDDVMSGGVVSRLFKMFFECHIFWLRSLRKRVHLMTYDDLPQTSREICTTRVICTGIVSWIMSLTTTTTTTTTTTFGPQNLETCQVLSFKNMG